MRLWIKATLLTLWHGIKYFAVCALAAIVGWLLSTAAPHGTALLLVITLVTVAALALAALSAWLFVDSVRDNSGRLLYKTWLEESARGGDERCDC